MTIVDELNAKIERDRASDAEAARLAGMTPEEFDADTTVPDPVPQTTISLEAAVRGSVFNRFVTAYGITEDREQFHAYALSRVPREEWTTDKLIELWTEFYTFVAIAIIQAEDAADEQRTLADSLV